MTSLALYVCVCVIFNIRGRMFVVCALNKSNLEEVSSPEFLRCTFSVDGKLDNEIAEEGRRVELQWEDNCALIGNPALIRKN